MTPLLCGHEISSMEMLIKRDAEAFLKARAGPLSIWLDTVSVRRNTPKVPVEISLRIWCCLEHIASCAECSWTRPLDSLVLIHRSVSSSNS